MVLVRLGVLLVALAGSVPAVALDDRDYIRLVTALTDAVVLPGYRAHADNTAHLAATLAHACTDDAQRAALGAEVDERFRAVMLGWQRVAPIRIGPVTEGVGSARIQYWPDRRGTGSRQFRRAMRTRPAELLTSQGLAQSSVALRDLQALERLLYSPNPIALLAAGGFPCTWAAAIAALQAQEAAALRAAWEGPDGHAALVRSAAAGNAAYFDAAEAATDFLRALMGGLEVALVQKLEPPLGAATEEAKPRLSESWRSGLSNANIAANLQTLAALYRTPGGFGDLLAATGGMALEVGIAAQFDQALGLIEAVPMPLSKAVADPGARQVLAGLVEALKRLRLLIGGALAPQVGLIIGFNATDGD